MKTSLLRVRTVFSWDSWEFAIHPQGDVERDRLFRRTVPAPGAAVFPAMAGIDHDGIKSMAGIGRDGGTATEQKTGREAEPGDGAWQTLHAYY